MKVKIPKERSQQTLKKMPSDDPEVDGSGVQEGRHGRVRRRGGRGGHRQVHLPPVLPGGDDESVHHGDGGGHGKHDVTLVDKDIMGKFKIVSLYYCWPSYLV